MKVTQVNAINLKQGREISTCWEYDQWKSLCLILYFNISVTSFSFNCSFFFQIIMEKVIKELPLAAVPNQFWGAVRIYMEKPHILNRRLCGSTVLWVGVSHQDFPRENLLRSLNEVLNHDYIDDNFKKDSEQSGSRLINIENSEYQNVNWCVLTKDEDTSNDDHGISSKLELNKLEVIMKLLHKDKFRSIHEEKSNSHHNINIATCDEFENLEKEEYSESPRCKMGNLENEQQDIPWHLVLECGKTPLMIVCVRRLLPKHVNKFSPTLEVVLIGKALFFVLS